MKRSKIKEIPFFPTRYCDNSIGDIVTSDTYSHASYEGEVMYDHNPVTKKPILVTPTMLPNTPFKDTLKYQGYYRERSSTGGHFTNDKGQRFTVFMTDMDRFIPLMVRGEITSEFIYCKRGFNYGVTLYTP